MRLEDHYLNEEVECEVCRKTYNPFNQMRDAYFILSAFWANNFCSRKCIEDKVKPDPDKLP